MENIDGFETKVIVGKEGRIVIPHKIRELLEIKDGDVICVKYDGPGQDIRLEVLR